MKDFAEFAALAESPDMRDAILEGTPELFDPRRVRSGGKLDMEKLTLALQDASVRSSLNLLRMYHEWLRDDSSE